MQLLLHCSWHWVLLELKINSTHSNWYTHTLVLQLNPDSNLHITQSLLPPDFLPNESLLCNSLRRMLQSTFTTTFILTLFLSKHICISFLILEYKIAVTSFLHIYYFNIILAYLWVVEHVAKRRNKFLCWTAAKRGTIWRFSPYVICVCSNQLNW